MTAEQQIGPWIVHTYATPKGPRMRVQRRAGRRVEVRKSASGRDSVFRTWGAASRVARRLNEDEATEAELRAKYADLPPLPAMSFATLARAVRGAS